MIPKFLFLELTRKCPLKCDHCCYWLRDDCSFRMDLNTYCEILKEFQSINPQGKVVLCGGESFLDPIFKSICEKCKELGLYILAVTSGITITNKEKAKELSIWGPHEITVSLDSPDKEEHNKMRGNNNAFDFACKATKLLANEGGVFNMCLITRNTAPKIKAFFDLSRSLGAKKCKLNFLQPTLGAVHYDPYFAANAPNDFAVIKEQIDLVEAKYNVGFNPRFISMIEDYCRAAKSLNRNLKKGWNITEFYSEDFCNSCDRNIMVSQNGELKLCFSMPMEFAKWQKPGDLANFWNLTDRKCMQKCKRICAISHSVRNHKSYI